MKMPFVDVYISDFETLTCQAGYVVRDQAVTRLFLNGLPLTVLRDLLKTTPDTEDYDVLKRKAIELTRANQLIEAILGQALAPAP
jgi:hypothetical protein